MKKRELKLTILERMSLIELLPKNGSLSTMGITEDIYKMVRITTEEIDSLGIKSNQSITKEQAETLGIKDYLISSDAMCDLLKNQAKRTDEEGKVTFTNIDLIRKINAL